MLDTVPKGGLCNLRRAIPHFFAAIRQVALQRSEALSRKYLHVRHIERCRTTRNQIRYDSAGTTAHRPPDMTLTAVPEEIFEAVLLNDR